MLALLVVVSALGGCSQGASDPLRAAFDTEMAHVSDSHYDPPSGDELAAFQRALVMLCRDGKAAARVLAPLHYTITRYREAAPGHRPLRLVHEETDGSDRRGWGWYLVACGSPDAPVIEVPHPVSDRGTARLGFDLFAKARAGALLVAGSKRDAEGADSDVAHAPTSVFLAVHQQLATPGRAVLQVHGFARDNHEDLSSQAVVSSGSLDPRDSDLARKVAEALRTAGLSVCEFGADNSCSDLGATENVEGMYARKVGARFVHLELDEDVRAGSDDDFVKAVAASLAG